jgi:hypothetical protein
MSILNNSAVYLNLKERFELIQKLYGEAKNSSLTHIGDYNMYPEKHVEFCYGAVMGNTYPVTAVKSAAATNSFQMKKEDTYNLHYSKDGNPYCLLKAKARVKTSESSMWLGHTKDLNTLDLDEVPTSVAELSDGVKTLGFVNSISYDDFFGLEKSHYIENLSNGCISLQPYMDEEIIAYKDYSKKVSQVTKKVIKDCYNFFNENFNESDRFVLTIVGTVNYGETNNVNSQVMTKYYLGTFSVYAEYYY